MKKDVCFGGRNFIRYATKKIEIFLKCVLVTSHAKLVVSPLGRAN
jgi:hypothetical protein